MEGKNLFIGPYSHHLNSRSSLACWRIVRWICTNLENCEFLQYEDFMRNDCHRNIKNIIYFYSSFYAKFDELILLMKKHPNSNLFWLYNEYSLALNSSIFKFFKERSYEIITNIAEGKEKSAESKNAKKIHILNTNITAYRDEIIPYKWEDKKYDLIYYGSYKPGRQDYVNEYFQDQWISTSPKNKNFFKKDGLKGFFINRLIWGRNNSTLNNFKFSVYIEDKHTHEGGYNHLSDRFYECISNGVVLFFDENTKRNVELSEYDIDSYFFVSSRNDLQMKMKEINNNKKLRDDYFLKIKNKIEEEKEELRNSLRNIF